jgi:hypothetical protein
MRDDFGMVNSGKNGGEQNEGFGYCKRKAWAKDCVDSQND